MNFQFSCLREKCKKITNIDYFVLLNTVLFIFMCFFVYFARFIKYIGSSRISEFYVYSILIIVTIICLWRQFRNLPFSFVILLLVECGIIAHFSGGLIYINGKRLYDCYFLAIRYDKYVHFLNAFATAFLLQNIFIFTKMKLHHLRSVVIFFFVLGLGAMVEVFEYLVTRNIKYNGVGGYDNNMQDLIFNIFGVAVSIIIWKLGGWRLLKERGE